MGGLPPTGDKTYKYNYTNTKHEWTLHMYHHFRNDFDKRQGRLEHENKVTCWLREWIVSSLMSSLATVSKSMRTRLPVG